MVWIDNGGNVSSPANPCFVENVSAVQHQTTVSTVGGSAAVTIPAQPNLTACIDQILIGASPLPTTLVTDTLSSTNLADNFSQAVGLGISSGSPVVIPMLGIQGNAPNTAVTFTLPAILLTTLTMSVFYHYQ